MVGILGFDSRRKILINRAFQVPFVFRIWLMMTFVMGIVYLSNVYFFWRFLEKGRAMGLPDDHVFFQFIATQQAFMNWIFAATGLVVTAFVILAGLLLSHRVAGPLYRLNLHMNEVAEGRTKGDVRFRPRDYFQELAVSFNRQTAFWRRRAERPHAAPEPEEGL